MERKLTVDDISIPRSISDALNNFIHTGWTPRQDQLISWAHDVTKHVLLSIARDPIEPSSRDAIELRTIWACEPYAGGADSKAAAVEWQRRMFRKPEPEVPEDVKSIIEDYGMKVYAEGRLTPVAEMAMKLRDLGRAA